MADDGINTTNIPQYMSSRVYVAGGYDRQFGEPIPVPNHLSLFIPKGTTNAILIGSFYSYGLFSWSFHGWDNPILNGDFPARYQPGIAAQGYVFEEDGRRYPAGFHLFPFGGSLGFRSDALSGGFIFGPFYMEYAYQIPEPLPDDDPLYDDDEDPDTPPPGGTPPGGDPGGGSPGAPGDPTVPDGSGGSPGTPTSPGGPIVPPGTPPNGPVIGPDDPWYGGGPGSVPAGIAKPPRSMWRPRKR